MLIRSLLKVLDTIGQQVFSRLISRTIQLNIRKEMYLSRLLLERTKRLANSIFSSVQHR